MAEERIVPAAGGVGLRLCRGERLRVIDPNGGQSGDLFALSADGAERLSNGRTFDYQGKIYLSTGDVLWSDRSSPMLTIVADDVGRHDFLYASCTVEMYRLQYGVEGDHPNCADNVGEALRSSRWILVRLPQRSTSSCAPMSHRMARSLFSRPCQSRAMRLNSARRWIWRSRSRRALRRCAMAARRRDRWPTRS